MSDIDIIACARRASTGCTCDPCKDLNVLAAYVAAVAPLVERLRQATEALSGQTVGGPALMFAIDAKRHAEGALLAADAAARGGK